MPINYTAYHIHVLENGGCRNTCSVSVESNGLTANRYSIELDKTFGHELRCVLIVGKVFEFASKDILHGLAAPFSLDR